MNTDIVVMRLIQAPKNVVFDYFIRPELLEQWSAPTGMTLKVPFFEAKIGGAYRFEHTAKDGVYICTGNIADMHPGSKIVQIDHITGPDGKVLFPKIETVVTFSDKPGGTFVTITVKGFAEEESSKGCEQSWNQCLDQLENIVRSEGQRMSA